RRGGGPSPPPLPFSPNDIGSTSAPPRPQRPARARAPPTPPPLTAPRTAAPASSARAAARAPRTNRIYAHIPGRGGRLAGRAGYPPLVNAPVVPYDRIVPDRLGAKIIADT